MTRCVVFAPDSFKGTVDAVDAAKVLAEGWKSQRPDDEVRLIPMADGGEGTIDAFALARPDARRMRVRVTGPDDQPVDADWLQYRDSRGRLSALVELANTSGITLLDPLRPFGAHTRGFGEAIAAALANGVDRLALAIGGSSSTEGGAGALAVLGARLLDREGIPIRDGVEGLKTLASLDFSTLAPPPTGGAAVLSDVTNPLLGPGGAAAVFGPQKGLRPGDVPHVERALALYGEMVTAATGVDPTAPGAGAAGGTGFALLAWGAVLEPGSAAVASELGLPEALSDADVVVTGEGRYDDQSEAGKVPAHVRELALAAGARCGLVAGHITSDASSFHAHVSLTDLAGTAAEAMRQPRRYLFSAGAQLARSLA